MFRCRHRRGACRIGLRELGSRGYSTVTNVEVTQAIQTPTNSISLVAKRSTAIRATIGIADNGGLPVAGVTGVAHIFRNGIEITTPAGLTPINAPLTAPAAPQRQTRTTL